MKSKKILSLGCLLAASGLTGCASIVTRSRQHLSINTIPSGADCGVYRKNVMIGRIASTPGFVRVSRRKQDIIVGCVKDGYDFTQAPIASNLNWWVWGNLGFGGLIGFIVDFADGRANSYHKNTSVTLMPLPDGIGQPILPTTFPGSVVRKPVQPATPSIVADTPAGARTDGPQRR